MKKAFLNILTWKLHRLARWTLKRYKPGIVGITGNVGKTSTKEAIKTVLTPERRVRAPSKNFNNEIGLPLTILGRWETIGGFFFWLKVILSSLFQLIIKNSSYPEILILEYGIDTPGDMKNLLEIARPHIGVVTAIGEIPVHVEFFAGKEGIIREKTKLVASLPATGFAVLNADDKAVLQMKNQTRAHGITFGFSESSDIKISNLIYSIDNGSAISSFKLNFGGSFVPVRLENVLGKSQCYAVAAAASVATIFGVNLIKVAENLVKYNPPPGRLRVISGIKESTILDDTYNSSPIAALEALEVLKHLKSERKIAVLGDMLELGSQTITAHESVGKAVAKSAKILFTLGTKAKFIAESAIRAGMPKKSVFVFKKLDETVDAIQNIIQQGDLILVKASQGVRLEKLIKEIMAEPDKAEKLLVRQNDRWLQKPGLYD